MKTPITFRISEFRLDDLKELEAMYPTCTRTEIIEEAIHEMLIHAIIQKENSKV